MHVVCVCGPKDEGGRPPCVRCRREIWSLGEEEEIGRNRLPLRPRGVRSRVVPAVNLGAIHRDFENGDADNL